MKDTANAKKAIETFALLIVNFVVQPEAMVLSNL